jgi:hypothetical protein
MHVSKRVRAPGTLAHTPAPNRSMAHSSAAHLLLESPVAMKYSFILTTERPSGSGENP